MNSAASGPKEWTNSWELIVDLDHRTEATKSARLRGALRDAIRDGRLEQRRRLPSSRALAADLGVSRGLVVETYEQLVAEGYLTSERGSGTIVADNARAAIERPGRPVERGGWLADFGPGTPDLAAFPRSAWASAVRTALRELPDAELTYRDPRGDETLRAELSSYLRRVRGAGTDPDRLFIVTGFTHGLNLVCRALAADGLTHLGVEDPGAYVQRDAASQAGLRLEPFPVDAGGVRVDLIAASPARAVMVTPAHQYPIGGVLEPERRASLLHWARSRADRLVIEDDYDAEFRYDRSPVGAMHGLAPEHVVLGGSVSKSLAPALRVGWIAAPASLAARLEEIQRVDYAHPSTIDQRALAVMLSTGRYDRHIRRVRSAYRKRRDMLLDAVSEVPGVTVEGVAAGLHVSLGLPLDADETAVTAELATKGVLVQGLSNYRLRPGRPGLVLGYAHLGPDELRSGAAVLAETLRRQL